MRFKEFKLTESKLFELLVPTSTQGPDIEKLQKLLLVFKYPVSTTGILDDTTKQALSQAQKDVGIPVTGLPDETTINTLNTAIKGVPGLDEYLNTGKVSAGKVSAGKPVVRPETKGAEPDLLTSVATSGSEPTNARTNGKEVIIGNEKRTGGSISWRTNNPGNVAYSSIAKSHGALGYAKAADGEPVAIMPTLDHGLRLQMALWRRPKYNDGTIQQGCRTWAKAVGDYKGTSPYTIALADAAGASIHTKVSDLSDEQLKNMVKKQAKLEGFKVGTVTTV